MRWFILEGKESLLEFAYNTIRENIQLGQYEQGSKLLPAEIATELGISVTPVKEAIHGLVSEGLVVAIPRRGHFVVTLNEKRIRDVMEMRKMIEIYAVEKVVKNANNHPDIIGEMEIIAEGTNQLADDNFRGIVRREAGFHKLFVTLVENEELLHFFRINWNISAIFLIRYMKQVSVGRRKNAGEEHARILKYLKEGNVRALTQLMETHFDYMEDMLDILGNNKVEERN